MAPPTIVLVRSFPFPVEQAYAWLTDYQDDDASRTDALIKERRVVSRDAKRVVMKGEHEAFGRVIPSTYVVDLAPPDRWTSRTTEGPRRGSVTTYHLTASPGGSTLRVEYSMVHEELKGRLLLRYGKVLVKRNIVRMWEGYEKAMRADLAGKRS